MKKLFVILSLFASTSLFAQGFDAIGGGTVTGAVHIDAQIYQKDSAIGAEEVEEKFRSNSFATILYNNGGFSAGMRFEAYNPAMLGYDARYNNKAGVANYFARHTSNFVDVTAGTFYEQFGSGLILRSYQDWNLGMDNSILGVNVAIRPTSGITIKALAGTQRYFWENKGMIRGTDAEFAFNEFVKSMQEWETRITLGGSFVSKFQSSEDIPNWGSNDTMYLLNLPTNVGSFATRLSVERGNYTFYGEYVYKINDPSAESYWTYNSGNALLFNVGYSTRGLGILLSAKSIDNMGFRVDRNERGQFGMINYIPALTRQHVYSLPSLYPYATQPNGEVGFQADVMYRVGRRGPSFNFNVSYTGNLKKEIIDDLTYKSTPFAIGKETYFFDANIDVNHRFNTTWRGSFMYMYQTFNQEIAGTKYGDGKTINAHIFVADATHSFTRTRALRMEAQYMHAQGGEGDWLMGKLEYTIAPRWFFSISDMWNVGNSDKDKRLHYYYLTTAFVHEATRIAVSYGRIRQGIVCAGGVCRELPASNGLMLTLTTSF
jgi:hypothetical protein